MKAQIHWGIYVEVDTETGEISDPVIDSEVLVGDSDGPVWYPEIEQWGKGYDLDDAVYNAAWKRLYERVNGPIEVSS
jgi:hypothetical protein